MKAASAEMFIYKEISNEGVNGAYFAEELRWLVENGAKTVLNEQTLISRYDVIHAQSIIPKLLTLRKRRYY
jgi:hypothetical protein